MQISLFESNKSHWVDKSEAPEGFYALHKNEATTSNVCNSCEAKKLCQSNLDEWCLENRCMSYEIIAADGKVYKRNDGQSVFFKRL